MDCFDTEEPVLKATAPKDIVSIEAISSKDGVIYVVPNNTEKKLFAIRTKSLDSTAVEAVSPVDIQTGKLQNGVYGLYARDLANHLSNPAEVFLLGVGTGMHVIEKVTIFPNPLEDILTERYRGTPQGHIEIRSSLSQIVFLSEMTGFENPVKLSACPAGLYVIVIRVENKMIIKSSLKSDHILCASIIHSEMTTPF